MDYKISKNPILKQKSSNLEVIKERKEKERKMTNKYPIEVIKDRKGEKIKMMNRPW